MILDTSLYNGEKDLLELRFDILRPKVDLYLVVEGELTFTGLPREIKHDWCMSRADVIHQITTHYPEASERNSWKREMYQRNDILRGIPKSLPDETLIMVSDVDEIPDPKDIPESLKPGELIRFQHEFYHFNFNNHVIQDDSATKGWSCSALCRLDDLRRWYPQGVRNLPATKIIQSGWHFSWMVEPAYKLKSYSHQELNLIEGTIEQKVQKRWDYHYEYIPGTRHLPKMIQDNPEKWSKYLIND